MGFYLLYNEHVIHSISSSLLAAGSLEPGLQPVSSKLYCSIWQKFGSETLPLVAYLYFFLRLFQFFNAFWHNAGYRIQLIEKISGVISISGKVFGHPSLFSVFQKLRSSHFLIVENINVVIADTVLCSVVVLGGLHRACWAIGEG